MQALVPKLQVLLLGHCYHWYVSPISQGDSSQGSRILVGAVLFICYVVWGIPLTIRLCKYIRGKLVARRQRKLAVSQARDLERNFNRACPSGGEY